MNKIRITKHFDFETAHALYGYDGKCKNIHGHSYHLHVTVIGIPIDDDQDPKNGMVMDFGDLKVIVKNEIIKLASMCSDSIPAIRTRGSEERGNRLQRAADFVPALEAQRSIAAEGYG